MPPKPKRTGTSPLARGSSGYYSSVVNLLRRKTSDKSLRQTDGDDTESTLSVPSLGEPKERARHVEELQRKLDETTATLHSKDAAISSLESRVGSLEASLDEARAGADAKQSAIQSLEEAKARVEGQLADTQTSLDRSQSELLERSSQLEAVRLQLEDINAQVEAERVARLNVENRLRSTLAAHQQLESAHAEVQEQLSVKASESQAAAARLAALTADLAAARSEGEDKAKRIGHLEVELGEVKEDKERVESLHDESLALAKSLEEKLAQSASAMKQTVKEVRALEADLQNANERLQTMTEELNAARVESAKHYVRIEEMESQLASANDLQAQAKADAQAAAEEHLRRLEEVENHHQARHAELSEETKRITTEFKLQETRHNTEIEALSGKYQNEMAVLTTQNSELERMHEADTRAIQELYAERDAAKGQIDALEAEVESQKEALSSTRAELAEQQEALASALNEVESLKAQLDESRQRAVGIETAKDEVIELLSADLSHARDTHTALKETFLATDRHAKELEDSARRSAEEVIQMRAGHQDEIVALYSEKTRLQRQIDADQVRIDELQREYDGAKNHADVLEKQLVNQNQTLLSTEEGFAECRGALALVSQEAKSLKAQLADVRRAAAANEKAKDQEITRVSKELSDSQEARAALSKAFNATKDKLSKRHAQEAAEDARRREGEMNQLRSTHQSAIEELHAKHQAALQQQVMTSIPEVERRDAELQTLRVDLANAKAALRAAEQQVQILKTEFDKLYQGAATVELTKDGVIRELRERIAALSAEKAELQRLHNMRLRDLEAQREQEILGLRQRLGTTGFLGGIVGVALAGIVHYV